MPILQTIGDVIRVAGNGITFGGADKIAQGITGVNSAALTAASRQRLGGAGDVIDGVADLAAPIGALGAVVKGGKLAIKGAKAAAPAVSNALKSALLPTIATHPTRAAVQALSPTLAQRAVAHPVLATLGATTGLGALGTSIGMSNAERTGLNNPAAPPPAAASAVSNLPVPDWMPQQPHAPGTNLSIQTDAGLRFAAEIDQARRAAKAGKAAPATAAAPQSQFGNILDAFSAEGGGMSLNELSALAQAHNQSRPAPVAAPKPPTQKDLAIGQLMTLNEAVHNRNVAAIEAMPAGAARDKAYSEEVDRVMKVLQGIGAPNMMEAAMAGMMQQGE